MVASRLFVTLLLCSLCVADPGIYICSTQFIKFTHIYFIILLVYIMYGSYLQYDCSPSSLSYVRLTLNNTCIGNTIYYDNSTHVFEASCDLTTSPPQVVGALDTCGFGSIQYTIVTSLPDFPSDAVVTAIYTTDSCDTPGELAEVDATLPVCGTDGKVNIFYSVILFRLPSIRKLPPLTP
jgi:hypothetical protein